MTLPVSNVVVTPDNCAHVSQTSIAFDRPVDEAGADIVGGGSYSGGIKVVSVVPGRPYLFTKGANDTSLDNGASNYTATRYFLAEAVTVTLNGAGAVTATIKPLSVQTYRVSQNNRIVFEFPSIEIDAHVPVGDVTNTVMGYSVAAIDTSGRSAVAHNSAHWQKHLTGLGNQIIQGITTDASDNVLVCGSTNGTIDFGTGPLTGTGNFIAKFNSSGVCQWVTLCAGVATLRCIACDSSGNVFVGGSVSGSVDFGGGALTSVSGLDAVMAKFNSSGVHQWSKIFGLGIPPLSTVGAGTAGHNDIVYGIATDSTGNVYITGQFHEQITFDSGSTYVGAIGIGLRAFLAKFNASGVHQWSKGFTANTDSWGVGVGVDSSNNVLIACHMQSGTLNFGGADLTDSAGLAIAKLNSSGTHQWSTSYSTSLGIGGQLALNGKVDSSGDLIVLVHYPLPPGDAGGGDLAGYGGSANFFVGKYSGSDGELLWAVQFGALAVFAALCVACGPSGEVIVGGLVGAYNGFIGPNNGANSIPKATDNADGWAFKLDTDGIFVWKEIYRGQGGGDFGRALDDSIKGVAIDSNGFAIIGGQFASQRISVGWQTFDNPLGQQYQGTTDAFIQKRDPCP